MASTIEPIASYVDGKKLKRQTKISYKIINNSKQEITIDDTLHTKGVVSTSGTLEIVVGIDGADTDGIDKVITAQECKLTFSVGNRLMQIPSVVFSDADGDSSVQDGSNNLKYNWVGGKPQMIG